MTVAINGRFLLSSFGGARRFAIELTERLARIRGDILLLTPPLPADVDVPDVPTAVIGRSSGPVWEQVELPQWLRRNGGPLLLNPATIAPFAYRNQISVVHDVAPALRPHDFHPLFRVQWRLSVRLGTLRRGQRLVTISEASRHEIAAEFRVDPERIDVVYAGADSLVDTAGEAGGDVPTAADAKKASFLVFGRHGAGKNVRIVLDALAVLPPEIAVEVRFIGNLDPALEPYAVQAGIPTDRLVWRGPVSDAELAHEYRAATAFVWPSLHEGFGIPPVEAQSIGTPVIASDIPINREVLADSAVYFAPTDAAALAAAMRRLADEPDLRADLGERGRQNAGRFTWERTALGWDGLIRRQQAESST